jgi:hypothetical protein
MHTFISIIEKLLRELETRRHAYIFCKLFTFLTQLKELDNQDIRKSVKFPQDIYTNDLKLNDLINEVLHLKVHIDVSSTGEKYNLLRLQTFCM